MYYNSCPRKFISSVGTIFLYEHVCFFNFNYCIVGHKRGYQIGIFNNPHLVIKNFYRDVYFERNNEKMSDHRLTILWAVTNGLLPFGGIFGAMLSGFVADKYGRYIRK